MTWVNHSPLVIILHEISLMLIKITTRGVRVWRLEHTVVVTIIRAVWLMLVSGTECTYDGILFGLRLLLLLSLEHAGEVVSRLCAQLRLWH